VTNIDSEAWQAELRLHDALFEQLAHGLPPQISATRQQFAARFQG
jgi:phosphoenolpyruvate carboxykinase (GTP)